MTVGIPHTVASLVGGSIGLALAHAFEAAYIARTIRSSIPSPAALKKDSEGIASLTKSKEQQRRRRAERHADHTRAAPAPDECRHRRQTQPPRCSIRSTDNLPATITVDPTALHHPQRPGVATLAKQRLRKRRSRARIPARQAGTTTRATSPSMSPSSRTAMARRFHNFLSPLADGSAVEALQPSPRLARASLNSAAPVLEDRFAPSRRNCMAPRALIGGGALLRIGSLSSLASQSG